MEKQSQDNFKLLSLKEESQLSLEELKKYYEDFRKYAVNRKLTNVTPGATTIAPKLKKATNSIASGVTNLLAGGEITKVSDGQENIPDGPVIYAHSHQGLLDNFAWIPATPDHAIILHSSTVKKALVLAQLNTGLILVSKKREDKENKFNAKLDMIKLGLEGHSIAYFPECAWNLSPNKLHLDMSFGFLDVAKKAGIPVVPVVDEFTYDTSTPKERITKIHTRFGEPIYVNLEDDLNIKLLEYYEKISTMRWDLIAEKGIFERKEISNIDYINFVKGNIRNLEMGGIDINVERELLWDSDNEFYKFHHINDVPFSEFGELLETEEVRKLKLINYKHNI